MKKGFYDILTVQETGKLSDTPLCIRGELPRRSQLTRPLKWALWRCDPSQVPSYYTIKPYGGVCVESSPHLCVCVRSLPGPQLLHH